MRALLLLPFLATASFADSTKEAVEKHAQAVLKDRPYAAMVVAVVTKEGEQFFPFGKVADRPSSANDLFEIGSITKVMTGTLLADRVKAGVVKLDDPVQKHLPNGWTMPRKDDRDITLLHLATHTSGLPRQPNGSLIFALKEPTNPYAKFGMAELIKGLPDTKIDYPIGSRTVYSNLGAGLLGHALVHASKAKSYEALLRERVLDPLGMKDTGIALDASLKARIAPGFDDKGKAQLNWDFGCIEGCGAIRSTTADMVKFARAYAFPPGDWKARVEYAIQPWRVMRPDEREAGLGWVRFVKEKPTTVWHNGQTGGYHSFLGFISEKVAVVVLCNVATPKVDDVGFNLLKHLGQAK